MDYDVCTSLPAMFFANTSEMGERAFLWERGDKAWQSLSGNAAHSQAAALSAALNASEFADCIREFVERNSLTEYPGQKETKNS